MRDPAGGHIAKGRSRIIDDNGITAGASWRGVRGDWDAGALWGLRARVVALVIVAALPVMTLIVLNALAQGRAAESEAEREILQLSSIAAANYDGLLRDAHRLTRVLARLSDVRRGGERCRAALGELLNGDGRYANAGVFAPNGDVICSRVPLKSQLNVADRSYFRRVIAHRRFTVGDYIIGRISGRAIVVLADPVIDRDGKVKAVVFVSLDLAWLNRFAERAKLPPGSTFTLLDRAGTVLARYPDPESWVGHKVPTAYYAMVMRSQSGVAHARGLDGVKRLYAFTTLHRTDDNHALYVGVGVPSSTAFAPARRALEWNLAVFALATFATLVLAWIGSRVLVLARIETLMGTARRIAGGDLSARTGIRGGVREIRELARTFDDMAEALETRTRLSRRDAERLYRLAYYDSLTNLPNRALFTERLKQILAVAPGGGVAVLMLHLERVKEINGLYGLDAGDALLKEAAARLAAAMPAGAVAARFGSATYGLLINEPRHPDELAGIATRLTEAFASPIVLDGHEVYATVRVGGAISSETEAPEALVRNADAALQVATAEGAPFRLFTPEVRARGMERFDIERELHRALERGEMRLHYQPVVDVKSLKVIGCEALLRWESAALGKVSPVKFIPIAEETGLIARLGEWVLETACRQAREWCDAGMPCKVAVNVSTRQLQRENFFARVVEVLRKAGFDPRTAPLSLEITESALMQNAEQAAALLARLRDVGLGFSIDDFGTGYSSLSYLKRLPVDTLKIDIAFIQGITHDPDDAAIVKAVIALAHSLGVTVIAEGVETEEQLAALRAFGCNAAQGFLFSPALPASEFERLYWGKT